jgi:hypothetical protein
MSSNAHDEPLGLAVHSTAHATAYAERVIGSIRLKTENEVIWVSDFGSTACQKLGSSCKH